MMDVKIYLDKRHCRRYKLLYQDVGFFPRISSSHGFRALVLSELMKA
jgi:hypothetical protein